MGTEKQNPFQFSQLKGAKPAMAASEDLIPDD